MILMRKSDYGKHDTLQSVVVEKSIQSGNQIEQ